jgi:hypothetical protein
MTVGGKSIPAVAPQRALDGVPFSTPPGSPFRALLPTADPMMEPKCHRGEKFIKLAVGNSLNFYA